MVEISNARYTELILKEQMLEIIRKSRQSMPSYEFSDVLKVFFDESEEKTDAE